MYIFTGRKSGASRKQRGKTNRLRGKLKARNRRRVNRMAGRRLGAKLNKKR